MSLRDISCPTMCCEAAWVWQVYHRDRLENWVDADETVSKRKSVDSTPANKCIVQISNIREYNIIERIESKQSFTVESTINLEHTLLRILAWIILHLYESSYESSSISINPHMNHHPLLWILLWIFIHFYESSYESASTSMNPHMNHHPLLWILLWIFIHFHESLYESSSTSMNPHKNLHPLLLIVEA